MYESIERWIDRLIERYGNVIFPITSDLSPFQHQPLSTKQKDSYYRNFHKMSDSDVPLILKVF